MNSANSTSNRARGHPTLLMLVALLALPLLLLWRLLLTNRILVGLDLFNYFYPYHDFAATSLLSGRLPLWNPHLFLGVPFLADSQAQLLYPLNWPLLGFSAPRALALSLALHLALAVLGTWLWSRQALRLTPVGAWVVAVVFVLGGYLGSQAEHPNQLAAAAWLPWLLLGAHLLWHRPANGLVLGSAALAFSLLAGHAQTTYISLVALALWLLVQLGSARNKPLHAHRRFVVGVVALGLLGAALAAAQLLPQAELSARSIRSSGLSYREAVSFSWDPRLWSRSLLPTFGRDDRVLSEYVAYVGFSGALLALLGLLFARRGRAWWYALLLAGTGFFLAPAIINPFYWLLWRLVPGFSLFRAPARWLLLAALGLAILAGLGAEWLAARKQPLERQAWFRLAGAIALLGLLAGASLLIAAMPARAVWPWWAAALLASGALLALPRLGSVWRAPLLGGLLVGELWLASAQLDLNKATAPEAYSSLRPAPAHLLTQQPLAGQTRFLSLSNLTWDPGDLAEIQARHPQLGPEASYDLVVATKLKEVLAPNQPMRWGLSSADGYGGGLLPLASYTTLQELLPLTKIVPDGRLRERLISVPAARWLDLLGVEWIVADKVGDLWVEGVYHLLTVPVNVTAGNDLEWSLPSPVSATALSLIGRAQADMPLNTQQAPSLATVQGRLVLETPNGFVPLDLAGNLFQPVRDTAAGTDWHAFVPLPEPLTITGLRLEAAPGSSPWTLAGLTLLDARLPAFEPLPADPAFETTLSGDVAILRRRQAPGRAWAVPEALVVDGSTLTATLAAPSFNPRQQVVLTEAIVGMTDPEIPPLTQAIIQWEHETPEQLSLRVTTDGAGWLVLADNWYPGWQATLAGRPVPILPANLFARAIPLPGPGTHQVVFSYRPPILWLGAIITLGGLLVWGVLLRKAQTTTAQQTED
jgi:hypothetical protein